jgi:hypothetical protein
VTRKHRPHCPGAQAYEGAVRSPNPKGEVFYRPTEKPGRDRRATWPSYEPIEYDLVVCVGVSGSDAARLPKRPMKRVAPETVSSFVSSCFLPLSHCCPYPQHQRPAPQPGLHVGIFRRASTNGICRNQRCGFVPLKRSDRCSRGSQLAIVPGPMPMSKQWRMSLATAAGVSHRLSSRHEGDCHPKRTATGGCHSCLADAEVWGQRTTKEARRNVPATLGRPGWGGLTPTPDPVDLMLVHGR